MAKKSKARPEGRTFLVLGCLDRTTAAATVMNKLQDGRVTEKDHVFIHAEKPYTNPEGEDIDPQWGEYMLGDRKKIELLFMATYPEGHFLFCSGSIVPVAPTVEYLKKRDASHQKGNEANKQRAKVAKEVLATAEANKAARKVKGT